MADDHYDEIASESRKEGQRLLPRALLFAVLLIMTHVLEIKPSDLDAGGLRIKVHDASVIRGGVAIVFYFYLWSMIMAFAEASLLMRVNATNRFARNLVASYRKPYRPDSKSRSTRRTPQQIKLQVRLTLGAINLFMTPFAITMLAVLGSAFVLGISDAYSLGEFVFQRLSEPASSIGAIVGESG